MKHICERNKCGKYLYVLFIIFCFWFATQIPYMHDDWSWGSDYGMYMWLYAPLNSRFVGNFFVVLMTHSKFAKSVIMCMFYFLFPYIFSTLVCKELGSKHQGAKVLLFVVCQCLLLTTDRFVLRQTYIWISGFANFFISVVFFMLWIREIGLVFEDKISPDNISLASAGLLFLLSIIGQLFVENMTIFALFISLYICLVRYIRIKTIYKRDVAMILGSFAGFLIMFSSHMYSTLWSTGMAIDGYREIVLVTSSSARELVNRLLAQTSYMIPNIYANNLVICEVILVLLSCLLLREKNKKSILPHLLCVANCVTILCLLLNHLHSNFDANGFLIQIVLDDIFLSLVYFVLVTVEIICLFSSKKYYMCYLLTIWLSVLGIQLPLVVTTATGGRLFFASCALSIFFALILLRKLTEAMPSKAIVVFTCVCLAFLIVLMVFYGTKFTKIHACELMRESIIEEAIRAGAQQIELPRFPYREYLVSSDPVNGEWDLIFKLYYGISYDVELNFK